MKRDKNLAIVRKNNLQTSDGPQFTVDAREPGIVPLCSIHCRWATKDLTRFNKIAIQGTPQMAVDLEAIELIESLLIK